MSLERSAGMMGKCDSTEVEFKRYVGDLCWRRPSKKDEYGGWVFGAELFENEINSSNSFELREKIQVLMREIASGFFWENRYSLVQFWATKMEEEWCYLTTSEHPYAVGSLTKGIAEFRKQCAEHHYFVDERAKQEELGPPGRVFQNSRPEISPYLLLYSSQEFPLLYHAQRCVRSVRYLALPVLDIDQNQCIGVLELLNFTDSALPFIADAFEIDENLGVALGEVKESFELVGEYGGLEWAEVWIPHKECLSSAGNCMEMVLSTRNPREFLWRMNDIQHVQTGKGIFGMLLASENKSCFCYNLSQFSITEEPRAHFDQVNRVDAYFAICLQSSHTGDFLYVAQFFFSLHSWKEMPLRLRNFFNFLLPAFKLTLTSFKVASGKELGEELVVEVSKWFERDTSISLNELEQPQSVYPVKYTIGRYARDEHL